MSIPISQFIPPPRTLSFLQQVGAPLFTGRRWGRCISLCCLRSRHQDRIKHAGDLWGEDAGKWEMEEGAGGGCESLGRQYSRIHIREEREVQRTEPEEPQAVVQP